jgi:hypothetical protein
MAVDYKAPPQKRQETVAVDYKAPTQKGNSRGGPQGTTSEGKETVAVDYQSLPQKLQKTVAIDRKVLHSEFHMGSRCTHKCNFMYANKRITNFPALFS